VNLISAMIWLKGWRECCFCFTSESVSSYQHVLACLAPLDMHDDTSG